MSGSSREYIAGLIAALHRGSIDRREFMKRAAAAGLSAALVGQVVGRYDAVAQDATPSPPVVAPLTSALQGIEHITDTSKGVIKLYSSWPLTGAYGAAPAATRSRPFSMCLEDFGNGRRRLRARVRGARRRHRRQQRWSGRRPRRPRTSTGSSTTRTRWSTWRTYNSGAAKISIPITNEAGMAQISYANTYPGLTKAVAGRDRGGRAGGLLPERQAQLHARLPGRRHPGSAPGELGVLTRAGERKAYVLHDRASTVRAWRQSSATGSRARRRSPRLRGLRSRR